MALYLNTGFFDAAQPDLPPAFEFETPALKTIFLLAISSLKIIGDIQALSVSPSCLEFLPNMVKAFLHSRPRYVPKDPTNVVRPIVLQAFYPPPFLTSGQDKLNLFCP